MSNTNHPPHIQEDSFLVPIESSGAVLPPSDDHTLGVGLNPAEDAEFEKETADLDDASRSAALDRGIRLMGSLAASYRDRVYRGRKQLFVSSAEVVSTPEEAAQISDLLRRTRERQRG